MLTKKDFNIIVRHMRKSKPAEYSFYQVKEQWGDCIADLVNALTEINPKFNSKKFWSELRKDS